MRERICNNCGGKKYKEIGQNMVKCLFCGTIYVDEYANKEEEILIVQAYEKIRDFKFQEAVKDFDKILALYPKSHEAYYGRLQAKNKVIYFNSKEGNKRYPSFFGKEIPNYFEDEDFKWLRVLNCMKKINMPIKKIKEYVELAKLGDSTLQQRYKLILEQKAIIKKQIDELNMCLQEFEYKEWYYQTAIEAGTEDVVKNITSISPTLEVDKIPKNYKKEGK